MQKNEMLDRDNLKVDGGLHIRVNTNDGAMLTQRLDAVHLHRSLV